MAGRRYRVHFFRTADGPERSAPAGPWSSLVPCWLHAQIARSRPAAVRYDVYRRDSVWGTHPSLFWFGGGCAFDPVISAGRRHRLCFRKMCGTSSGSERERRRSFLFWLRRALGHQSPLRSIRGLSGGANWYTLGGSNRAVTAYSGNGSIQER